MRRLTISSIALLSVSFAALALQGCGGGGYDGGGSSSGGGYSPPPAPNPPTIGVAPLPTQTVNRTVTLTANVTAPAGVTNVEFLVDGTVVGSTTTSPYTFAWDTSAVADGAHSVTARVTDAASNVVTSAASTVNVVNQPTIRVDLSPDQTFPRPTSTASGSGDLTFNLISGAVTGGFTVTGITPTAAHIHEGYAGGTGGIIVNFAKNASDPNRWEPQAGALLTAAQVDELLAGRLYVNVHSPAHPAGEIRAQIVPDTVDLVFSPMSGTQVVPAVTNTASGVAATTLDTVTGLASVHANVTGVDDATEAHVHKAAAGANNATALLTLTKDSVRPTHWSIEAQATAEADRTDFAADGWYVDVHTPTSPGGALRGQISPSGAAPPTPPASPTLAQLQASIFTPRCSGCHTGGGSSLPGSMNLSSAAASFAALVGVASQEQPTVQRVAAGNAAASYLVQKLEGASTISGARMPLGGPFLDQATIDQVKAWINAGAANN